MQAEPMISALQQKQAFKLSYLAAVLIAAFAAMPWACGTARAEPGFSFDTAPGKLPKTVIPVHYAIELTPICRSSRLPELKASTSRYASRPRR
jgi:hypothetical protein